MNRLAGPIDAVWDIVASSPPVLAAALLCAGVLCGRLYLRVRWIPLMLLPRDPSRRFSAADRTILMRRAGGRCEFYRLRIWRCGRTEDLHADHIHPHAKGGTTTVDNGQMLCAKHNLRKRARIPANWELRLIRYHRSHYSPENLNRPIVRRERQGAR